MNRNNDTPQAPTLAAEAGPVGASPSSAENEGDGLVDHDPTLKWIISDLVEGGQKTPPPLPQPTIQFKPNERPPPLFHRRASGSLLCQSPRQTFLRRRRSSRRHRYGPRPRLRWPRVRPRSRHLRRPSQPTHERRFPDRNFLGGRPARAPTRTTTRPPPASRRACRGEPDSASDIAGGAAPR